MDLTAEILSARIEAELDRLRDQRVVRHIRGLLVPPRQEMREWDYEPAGTSYPCWVVLAHMPSDTAIAYCEHGFGPRSPWGLLALAGPGFMSMGMDCGWFARFPDAYFDSPAATELPIWQVFERRSTAPRMPVTPEDSWEAAWAEVHRLRCEHPERRYDVGQSLHTDICD
jgi:hypothetical protein